MIPFTADGLADFSPTGRDNRDSSWATLRWRPERVCETRPGQATLYPRTVRCEAGVVLLDAGGTRTVLREGDMAEVPERTPWMLIALGVPAQVHVRPCDAR